MLNSIRINAIIILYISICLMSFNQLFFYDTRKKPMIHDSFSNTRFLNTTIDLIVDHSNKIIFSYDIKYRNITMV